MIFQVVLFMLSIQFIRTDAVQCEAIVGEIIELVQSQNSTALIQTILPYWIYSGKGLNRFGDYNSCMRNPNMQYLDILISFAGTSQTSGICVTNQCDVSVLQKIYDTTLLELTKIPITFYPPDVYNPTEYSVKFYIIILAFIVLFFISLVHPVSQLIKNYQNRKTRYAQIYNRNDLQINDTQYSFDHEIQKHPQTKQKDDPKDKDVMMMFSLKNNFEEFVDFKVPDKNLQIFNGLRAIAFMMVVFGHQFLNSFSSFDVFQLLSSLNVWTIYWCVNCFYSVDIFFWIGGFFLGFVMADTKKVQMMKKQGILSIPPIIIHRLLRIWPCYIFTIFIVWSIEPYLANGPKAATVVTSSNCSDNWWRAVLLIDNLFDNYKNCVGWGWYLSNDIQLFIVCLIPMFVYSAISKILGKMIVVLLLVASVISSIYVSYKYNLLIPFWTNIKPELSGIQFVKYYIKPYCRGGPYFLGLLFGISYREHKIYQQISQQDKIGVEQPFLSKLQNFTQRSNRNLVSIYLSLYVSGGSIILYFLLGWRSCQTGGSEYWSQGFQSFYHGVCRTLFCLGLTLICTIGCVGIQDTFNTSIMNNKVFRFMAKLGFSAYMVHFIVEVVITNSIYSQIDISFLVLFQLFIGNIYQQQIQIGNLIITLVFATIMTLVIEMPLGNLEAYLMGLLLMPQKKQQQDRLLK